MIITDMPRGGGGNKSDMMLASFERLERLEQDIQNEQDKLIPLLDDIRNIIESIEIVRHYEVMTWRYIVGLTWEEVAERMGYDIRHVTRLHGQALNRLT
jgi:DNA-directed RNA polymerase specialized sigma subunit